MARRLALILAVVTATAASAQTPRPLSPAEATQVTSQLESVSRELVRLVAEQARGGDGLGADRARLEALNAQEAQLRARLGANQNELSHLLSALQMYGRNPPPALLIHPEDARKAVRAAILIRAVTPELQRRAQGFAAEVETAAKARRQAATASEALFTSESQVAERASRIEGLIAQRLALQKRLGDDGEGPDAMAVSARAQNLRAAAARPEVALRTRPPGRFTAPVAGAPSAKFNDPARGGPIQGWVWATARNATVASPATGRVEYAGALPGWENVVILDIGDGYHLVVAGMRSLTTATGQTVAAGQPLGRMAAAPAQNSGEDGPELYLEVRKGGDPVDPARFFAAIGG